MEYRNGQESAEQLVRPPIIHDEWVPRARAAYEASKTSAEASKASADEAIIRYHDAARIILEAQAQRPLGDQLTQDEIAASMDISQTAVSKLLIWEKKYGALVAAGETGAIRSPWYQPPQQQQLTTEEVQERAQKKVGKKNAAVQAQEAFKQVQHGYESQLETLTAELAKLRANPPAPPPVDDFVHPAPPPAAEPSGIDVNALAASVAAWLRTQDADVTELLENFCADVRRLLAP